MTGPSERRDLFPPGPRPRLAPPRFEDARRGTTPLRLLWSALLWILASSFGGFGAAFLFGLIIGFHNAFARGQPPWVSPPLLATMFSITGTQLTLLRGAWSRADALGSGNVIAGWGAGPLRHRVAVIALVALQPLIVLAWSLILTRWHGFATPIVDAAKLLANRPGPPTAIIFILLIVAVAPVCEELFFRGWLWVGLRRRWPTWAVGLVTGLFWLALHFPEGGAPRMLILLPTAIMLTLTRALGHSVRASIALHAINNLTAVAILGLAALSGR